MNQQAHDTSSLHWHTREMLKDPVGFGEKMNIFYLQGTYGPTKGHLKENLKEATALWSLFYPESAFYREVRHRIERRVYTRKEWFDRHIFDSCVKTNIENVSALDANIFLNSENPFVRMFYMFMQLPDAVARRWLWHENVDFQTPETFFRRLTPAQYESLSKHYELSVSDASLAEYPCFKDGARNKLWRMFGLKADIENRMSPKSAIAYDFFGMNFGFQKYPKLADDTFANPELASQFLSVDDRGSFEVNKEVGGVYWYLYKTLRSNSLYRKNKTVKLGTWICPGVWATMIAWVFYLLISPLCLLAALTLYGVTKEMSYALLALGAVSPVIYTAWWTREHLSKGDFVGDYWPSFGATLGIIFLGFLFTMIFMIFHRWISYWVLLLNLLFLVPYWYKQADQHKIELFNLAYFGKSLPIAFVLALGQDLWVHTMFFEFCYAVVSAIGGFLWWFLVAAWEKISWFVLEAVRFAVSNWKWLLGGAGLFGLYTGLLVRLTESVSKASSDIEHNMRENKSFDERKYKAVDHFFILTLVIMIPILGAAAYSIAQLFEHFVITITITLGIILAIPLIWKAGYLLEGKIDPRTELMHEFLRRQLTISRWESQKLSKNAYWFETDPLRLKTKELRALYELVVYEARLWLSLVEQITSAAQHDAAVRFLKAVHEAQTTHIVMRLERSEKRSQAISMILRGSSVAEIMTFVTEAIAKRKSRDAMMANTGAAVLGVVETTFGVCGAAVYALWRVVSSPFRFVIWLSKNVYGWWKLTNESCPPSPPQYRGTFS